MFTKEAQELAKPTVEAIKKISKGKWEWEPEWLDPLLFTYGKYSEVYWFKCSDSSERFKGWIFILTKGIEEAALHVPKKSCIPLLHWERIEEILEGMGYWIHFARDPYNNHRVTIWEKGERFFEQRNRYKTRQEAVMRAVIELGKEE